ncbi:MAG: hypothetical protein LBS01_11830 [Prevotellaceae bacterium]|jgi:hypothetical protein|nr:hypothetical protein [Prevotellaceae bacterium]
MKTLNLKKVAVVALIAALASCGGGSGSKLPANEVLGNVPSIVHQYAQRDSVIEAEEDAAMSKLNPASEADWKKAAKIAEDFKARQKELDMQYEEALAQEQALIVGKDVPVETEDGTGYEVTGAKIVELQKSQIVVEFELKITDIAAATITGFSKPQIVVFSQEIDKNGNQIGRNSAFYIDITSKENGVTAKGKSYMQITRHDARQMVDFAKIKFVKNK